MSSDDETAQAGPAARERPNWHDDILPVLRETDDPLTAAYIAVLWDSSARSSRVASLTVDDITRDGLRYKLETDENGTTDTVEIVAAAPHLAEWLEIRGDEMDTDAVWVPSGRTEPLSLPSLRHRVQEAAARAGVNLNLHDTRRLQDGGKTNVDDEFQQRLEDLGLVDDWREVGRTFARIHRDGDDPDRSLLLALEKHAAPDADLDALRKEWVCEQHRFHEVTHEVEVRLPHDVQQAIERRMALYGRTPESDRGEYLDLALEIIVVTLAGEGAVTSDE